MILLFSSTSNSEAIVAITSWLGIKPDLEVRDERVVAPVLDFRELGDLRREQVSVRVLLVDHVLEEVAADGRVSGRNVVADEEVRVRVVAQAFVHDFEEGDPFFLNLCLDSLLIHRLLHIQKE